MIGCFTTTFLSIGWYYYSAVSGGCSSTALLVGAAPAFLQDIFWCVLLLVWFAKKLSQVVKQVSGEGGQRQRSKSIIYNAFKLKKLILKLNVLLYSILLINAVIMAALYLNYTVIRAFIFFSFFTFFYFFVCCSVCVLGKHTQKKKQKNTTKNCRPPHLR